MILGYPLKQSLNLDDYVRLAAEGPEFSVADANSGLLLLDASWRWATTMTGAFENVPARSLHGYKTAYPRVSKQGTDPAHGLATVEALYIAHRILGRSTLGLLDHYHWRDEFLRLNCWNEPQA
jgi:pre-rRNA-processing protein TSR3